METTTGNPTTTEFAHFLELSKIIVAIKNFIAMTDKTTRDIELEFGLNEKQSTQKKQLY